MESTPRMAQRSTVPVRTPFRIQAAYEFGIICGVSVAIIGISVTVLMALVDASTRPYSHWLSGQIMF